jgi:hypothetical protein
MPPVSSAEREAQRQRALLGALRGEPIAAGLREQGERAARGLEAYRANAEAIAERALAAGFATVRAMVGADDFGQLAREFWRAQPPLRGDLGEWGEGFAGWLQAHPAMMPWPYLADCARLDFALHRCERAADASLAAASLSLLESGDPARLRLELMPGTALIRSTWPIASIHAAHQLSGGEAERAFEQLREAIALPRGEYALVARDGWRAVVHRVGEADARWTQSLLDGRDLARALGEAGAAFDFSAWLQNALRHTWLKGVSTLVD